MLIVILVLGLFVRLMGSYQSFWLDEAAQLIESARPLSQQLDISGDFQPPLFHLLLHGWLYGGRSEVWIRLLPIGLGVASIWVTYLLAKELTNKRNGLLTAMLLSISPFHVWYSQEVRPYAFAVLLGLVTTYYLIRKKFLPYTVGAILFVYTLYLAPFLLVAQGIYLYIFDRKQVQNWLKAITFTVIVFLPWIPYLSRQLTIGKGLITTLPGWSDAVSTPLIKAIPLIFTKFLLGRITIDNKIIYGILVGGLFGLCVWWWLSAWKKDVKTLKKLCVLIVIPIVMAFITSLLLPILAPQRVLFVLPLFLLTLVLGIETVPHIKILSYTILISISVLSLYIYATNPRFQREHWREAVQFVEEKRTGNTLALFAFPEAFAPWQWYSRGVVQSQGLVSSFAVTSTELTQRTAQITKRDQLFYFHYLTDLTDPHREIPKYLSSLGFQEVVKTDFPGVGFVSTYEKVFASR